MILTISGAAGSGKSTLAKTLVKTVSGAILSPGYSTRPTRRGESMADVRHISEESFAAMNSNNEFLWTASVHGNSYGTLRSEVISGLMSESVLMILVLAPDVLPVLRSFAVENNKQTSLRSVYVLAPSVDVLRVRLLGRDGDLLEVDRRVRDCLDWDTKEKSSSAYDLFIRGDGDIQTEASIVSMLVRRNK